MGFLLVSILSLYFLNKMSILRSVFRTIATWEVLQNSTLLIKRSHLKTFFFFFSVTYLYTFIPIPMLYFSLTYSFLAVLNFLIYLQSDVQGWIQLKPRPQISKEFKPIFNSNVCIRDLAKLEFNYILLHIDKLKSVFRAKYLFDSCAFSNICLIHSANWCQYAHIYEEKTFSRIRFFFS